MKKKGLQKKFHIFGLWIVICLGETVFFNPKARAENLSEGNKTLISSDGGGLPSLPALFKKVSPGVVNISSVTVRYQPRLALDATFQLKEFLKKHQSSSLGSGVLLDREGFILTNRHVVASATEVWVNFFIPEQQGGSSFSSKDLQKTQVKAQILGSDEKTDLALLRVSVSEMPPVMPVELGDSDAVEIGESVFAIGNPAGFSNTLTQGIISGKNRFLGLSALDRFLQTDTSINPGNSGGGLFAREGSQLGKLIGICAVIHSPTGQSSGLGFVIPVNQAKKVIPSLKKYGRVIRPWLGIHCYELSSGEGVLVVSTFSQKQGSLLQSLRKGDLLIELAGEKITRVADIERILDGLEPSQWGKVSAKVLRNQKNVSLSLALKEAEPPSKIPSSSGSRRSPTALWEDFWEEF